MRDVRHRLLRSASVLASLGVLAGVPLIVPTASAVVGGAGAEGRGFATRLDIGTGQRACTGALVDLEWVLTAASCFVSDPAAGLPAPSGTPPEPVTATVGRPDLMSSSGHERTVVELVAHPSRDLVLARLDDGVTDVAPVPVATHPPSVGEDLEVLGFGRTATEWAPLSLHAGGFAVDSVTGADVALSGRDGAAICAGDAGGPALRATGTGVELVAVHSRSWQGGCFGADPAETRTGAVDTRVDDVGDWISDVAWRNRNIVHAVFTDSLGVPATAEQMGTWEYRVSREGAGVLLDAVENTDRYRTVRIVDAFEATFGYTPSDEQVANHLAAVKDGTRTIDQVEPFLLARSNYYALVGGTDEAYVKALYAHMFHRAPSENDLAVWLDRLPRMGRQGVVDALWANTQAVRVRVVETYEHYLGQTPTTEQTDHWVTQLTAESVPTEAPLRRVAVGTARYAAYANARF